MVSPECAQLLLARPDIDGWRISSWCRLAPFGRSEAGVWKAGEILPASTARLTSSERKNCAGEIAVSAIRLCSEEKAKYNLVMSDRLLGHGKRWTRHPVLLAGRNAPHLHRVAVTGKNGNDWHDWGTGFDRFKGLCKNMNREISKPCYQIRDCKECLAAKDSRPEYTSVCVPVKPETNGNVCEPKIYIEKNKNVLKLQEDTECGIVEEAGEDADEPSDTGRQYYAGSRPTAAHTARTAVTGSMSRTIPIDSWKGTSTCVDAQFPSEFPVQDNSVFVQVTSAHQGKTRSVTCNAPTPGECDGNSFAKHQPTTIWVEGVTARGFRLCIQVSVISSAVPCACAMPGPDQGMRLSGNDHSGAQRQVGRTRNSRSSVSESRIAVGHAT
eukprot:331979-Rhodomonas_salina.4